MTICYRLHPLIASAFNHCVSCFKPSAREGYSYLPYGWTSLSRREFRYRGDKDPAMQMASWPQMSDENGTSPWCKWSKSMPLWPNPHGGWFRLRLISIISSQVGYNGKLVKSPKTMLLWLIESGCFQDENARPHGFGEWQDNSYHGEVRHGEVIVGW